ncbi:beta-agarase [Mariniblastus fucicola]|nr:beta-agarase [Mariniblastus fucicola]
MTTVRSFILATMAILVATFTLPQGAAAQKLSEEGQLRKSAHTFLFQQFATNRKCDFSADKSILKEIVVIADRVEANGELMIELPEGAQRIASMFRHLTLRGENLDRVGGLTLEPYQANATMHHSIQKPDIYRVQMGSLPLPRDGAPNIVLRAKTSGPVVVSEVAFSSQGKLRTTFDDIPFRNLGDEHPVESVVVEIDTTRELSISGHVDLEREKFFRFYARPGMHHPSAEKWAYERNFLPGRQISKMQYALVKGYSKNQPKLKESKSKQGHADLSFFDAYDSTPTVTKAIEPIREIDYAMCLDNWPDFMSIDHVGRGTPKVEFFDAAAELAGAVVADQIKDGGRTATWWEVKNESTIKSEWDYHWAENSWDLLADFHNKVADAIHERAPETKVGGPSSAWMQLQIKDFSLYKSQRKFMDATKGKLDFYSHHFYEDFNTIGAWERRSSTYSNYLAGRLEAILNMFRAHMHGTDNVRPILITECGSLQPGTGPSDYWLRLRSWSAYTHKFMQRPNEIDMSVPFAFLTVPWNPNSGNAAFVPDEDGKGTNGPIENLNATPVTHFFDLWSDFDGRRLPVSFSRKWLDVTALHDGKRIHVALTNMGGQRLNVELSGISDLDSIESIRQKRLFYRDGKVHFDPAKSLKDLSAVDVDVEETTIVTIELKQPLEVEGLLRRECFYAADTAIKADGSAEGFRISIPKHGDVEKARLIIGVHRDGGLKDPLELNINGKTTPTVQAWASDVKNLFDSVVVHVPTSLLKAENVVKVGDYPGLTITSMHIETDSAEK